MAEIPILAFACGYGIDNMPKGLRQRWQFRREKRQAKSKDVKLEYSPGLLSRMVIDAAAQDPSQNKGVAGSALFGYPPHGEIAQRYMKRIAPTATVINFGKAWTTNTEVRAVKRGAIEEGLENGEIVLYVADPHRKRAEELAKRATKSRKMKKRGITFTVKTAESVLFKPEVVGEQKATEYQAKYAGIEEDEKYQKLLKQGRLAVLANRSRLITRTVDFIYAIHRRRF